MNAVYTSLRTHVRLLTITAFALIALFTAQPSVGEEITETPPPGTCRILSPGTDISIPFEIYRGDIRFKCRVNGRDVHMLLDDGYMWDDLLFWGGPETDSLNLTFDGETEVDGGTSEGESLFSNTASGITVSFPGVEFTDQRAIVTPASSGVAAMWAGSVGQVSTMFFKHFVVDINFDKMIITLIKPDEFEYTGAGVAIPWEPLGYGPFSIPLTLTLADGRRVTLKPLMDLGYNDQLELWTGKENKIPVPEKALPANLGMNIQGIPTMGFLGRISSIDIGGYETTDALVAFAAEEHGENSPTEAMIGLGLLSRFNLVFDYYSRRLFIQPTQRFNDPFEYDMSGLVTRPGEGAYREILRTRENSPAAEAGLQIGDRLTHINGQPIADLDVFELRSMLRQEGATVRFNVVRGDREWEVALVLRRLI